MKYLIQPALSLLLLMGLTSCGGDRKAIVDGDYGDTSFVNTSFSGNLIDFSAEMSACEKMPKAKLASLYGVSEEDIFILDSAKDPRVQAPNPSCTFRVKTGESEWDFLTGGMSIQREIGKDEFMGDVAEASGGGENWVESWSLQKQMYKSASWVPQMGKAALWRGKTRSLNVKLEGYTLSITAPGAAMSEKEKALNRNYKNIAIEMAKAAGFVR